jgi:hypothetical protein
MYKEQKGQMGDVKTTMASDNRIKSVLGQQVLFFIERNTDDSIVVYNATRKNNTIEGVDVFWTKRQSLSQRSEVSSSAKKLLFGCELKAPEKGKTRYGLRIEVLPSRFLELVLKKSNGSGPGEVVARGILKGKECDIIKLSVSGKTGGFGIVPSVESITITGTHKGNVYQEDITSELMSNIDPVSIFRSLITG